MLSKTRTTLIALVATAVLAIAGATSVASAATTQKPGPAIGIAQQSEPATQPNASFTQCTAPAQDGTYCNVKTCTSDIAGAKGCSTFAFKCRASGHKYEGDSESGTCTRQVYA